MFAHADDIKTHEKFFKNSWFLQNFRRERTVFHFIFLRKWKICGVFSAFLKCEAAIFFWTWCDSNMITFLLQKHYNLSCLNKKNCLVNSKVKEFFMCFYVICMSKHVGITLSVFLLVLCTGTPGTDHPLFPTFWLKKHLRFSIFLKK
jgi:glycosyltransferase involved in cell wall biosynthesis